MSGLSIALPASNTSSSVPEKAWVPPIDHSGQDRRRGLKPGAELRVLGLRADPSGRRVEPGTLYR